MQNAYFDLRVNRLKIFINDKNSIGIIKYTANADLLLNLYNGGSFTMGVFGGF